MKTLLGLVIVSGVLSACVPVKEEVDLNLEGGVWQTACATFGSSPGSLNSTVSFEAGQFVVTASIFTGSGCSGENQSFKLTGTYTLPGPLEGSSSQKIDMTLGNYTATPSSAAVASELNANSYCGITNWSAGVERSIAGLTCEGETIPQVGDVSYDIYYIHLVPSPFNSQGDLQFGSNDSSHDGTTEQTRPNALNATVYQRN